MKSSLARFDRFNSAIVLHVAMTSIASHNFNASSPRGALEITGPKKLYDVSESGWNVMIGVPTPLPVRSRATT